MITLSYQRYIPFLLNSRPIRKSSPAPVDKYILGMRFSVEAAVPRLVGVISAENLATPAVVYLQGKSGGFASFCEKGSEAIVDTVIVGREDIG